MTGHKARPYGMNLQPVGSPSTRISAAFIFSVVFFAVVSVALFACSGDAEDNRSTSDAAQMEATGAQQDGEASETRAGESASEGESGEHGGEGGEGGENEGEGAESDEGEESGDSLALDETYDVVRKGARLVLRYDPASNTFVGSVANTTDENLRRVRVEVHLSNGTELGPTTPVDLAPGEMADVSLSATEEPFTGWTPHAEVDTGDGSGGEHGEGGEGGGEHGGRGEGGEGGGEHGGG